MSGKKWAILLLLLICFFIVPASAATLQVCKLGCTYSTIQGAINAAATDDTVDVIDNEIYREKIVINKTITLKSSSLLGPATIVFGENITRQSVVAINATGAKLRGFNIRYDGANGTVADVVGVFKSNIEVAHNNISTNASHDNSYNRGVLTVDGLAQAVNNITIENNTISTTHVYSGSPISMIYSGSGSSGTKIRNNILKGICDGLYLQHNNTLVYNNTMYGSRGVTFWWYTLTGRVSNVTNNTHYTYGNTPQCTLDYTLTMGNIGSNKIFSQGWVSNDSNNDLKAQIAETLIYGHNMSSNAVLYLRPNHTSGVIVAFKKSIQSWNQQRIKFDFWADRALSINLTGEGMIPGLTYSVYFNGGFVANSTADGSGKLPSVTVCCQPQYGYYTWEIRNSSLGALLNSPDSVNVTFLTGDFNSTDRLMLEWIDKSTSEDKWQIQRSTDGSSWTTIVNVSTYSNATTGTRYTYNSTGLSTNIKYHYRIQTWLGTDYSEWTNTVARNPSTGNVFKYTRANAPTSASHDNSNQTTIQQKWTWVSGGAQSEFYASSSAGNSGWISGTSWTQAGLSANTRYTVTVRARNGDGVETSSASHSAYTSIESPTGVQFGSITSSSIQARAAGTFTNMGLVSSATWTQKTDGSTNSGWVNNTYWNSTGLSPNTQHCYASKARNGDSDETLLSVSQCAFTHANPPGIENFGIIGPSYIQAKWNSNENPTGTQYAAERCTDSAFTINCANSGWISQLSYNFTNLNPTTTYHFRVKARNSNNLETTWTNLGSETPDGFPPNYTISYPVSSIVARNFPIVFDVDDGRGVNDNTCYYEISSALNNIEQSVNSLLGPTPLRGVVSKSISCPNGETSVWISAGPYGDCQTQSVPGLSIPCKIEYYAKDSIGNTGQPKFINFTPNLDLIHDDDFQWCNSSFCWINQSPYKGYVLSGLTGQNYSIRYDAEGSLKWRVTSGKAKVGGRESGWQLSNNDRAVLKSVVTLPQEIGSASFSFDYTISTQIGDALRFSVEQVGSAQEQCSFSLVLGQSASGEIKGHYDSLTNINALTPHCNTLTPGTYIFRWEYKKDSVGDSGDDSVLIDNFKIELSPLALSVPTLGIRFSDGFEDGTLSPFVTDGNPGWSVVTGTSSAGIRSAQSGNIDDSENTNMILTQDVGHGGILVFSRKISTEQGYDYLRLFIDGVKVDEWSGEIAWGLETVPLGPGIHVINWSYQKDQSRSAGQDTVWIDEVYILTDEEGVSIPRVTLPEIPSLGEPSTIYYSDNFNDGIPYVNGADLWVQRSRDPAHVLPIYQEVGFKMEINGQYVDLNGYKATFLLPNNYNWSSYTADYDAEGDLLGDNELNPRIGGFVLRYVDTNNWILIQPFRPGDLTSYPPFRFKMKNGVVVDSDLVTTYILTNSGWPNGKYKVTANRNVYTVYIDGVRYMEFVDTKSDFLKAQAGLSFVPGEGLHTSHLSWDNVVINGTG